MSIFSKNPKIEVKPTARDKNLVKLGWAIVALNILLVLVFYFDLPETIPTHFNLKGEADGHGHKSTLWIIPIISAALYFGLGFFVTKMKPYHMNYPVKVTEKNAPELYALGIRMIAVMNLASVIAFLLTTVILLLYIKGIVGTIDVQLLVGSWIIVGALPFLYIFKMYSTPK
ncbi:DUF1648 domain-containing protein [Flagellimonas sp. S3867]|uniref:DUF1648 domain-containing protein n=1 Tax=Flagellimonas sp. S3867 TaxID=2768063 RepID=UPI0016855326|nr:DUF1648 domain-containing protein [Flagellimonas sp. S3867]